MSDKNNFYNSNKSEQESSNSDNFDDFSNIKNNNSESINQFIKIIDIDDLSPEDLLRIIVAVGSKNMAYYLALIVNFENRSRKISPLGITKILSSKSVNAPNSNPIKTTFTADPMTKNKDLNKS